MSRLGNLARSLGRKPWFAKLGKVFTPVDKFLGRVTGGRVLAYGIRDLPTLLLTTTGRKSGKPRTTPLLHARDGEAYVVVGSNWGQADHPSWTVNLLADPHATVVLRGKRIGVTARLVTGEERDRLWDSLRDLWPGYDGYAERSGRHLRVFVLDPR